MIKPVLERMDHQLILWEQTKDKRQYFLQCYRLMTSNMLKAIDKEEFNDNAWVKQLLERFANYYFNALHQYETNTSTPYIWNEVFENTTKRSAPITQLMILGVNAHINFDLVFCLKDMLIDEWKESSLEQKKKRYEDHCKVNQIIAATIDRVQDEIIEPGNYVMQLIDSLMGRLDEYLLSKVITSWREDVWQKAVHLVENIADEKKIYDEIELHAMRKMKYINLSL